MNVNSIKLVNFENDRISADIIIENDESETFMGHIHQVDALMKQLRNGREAGCILNYLILSDSLLVDEIIEGDIFNLVHSLINDGDFFNVFKKI